VSEEIGYSLYFRRRNTEVTVYWSRREQWKSETENDTWKRRVAKKRRRYGNDVKRRVSHTDKIVESVRNRRRNGCATPERTIVFSGRLHEWRLWNAVFLTRCYIDVRFAWWIWEWMWRRLRESVLSRLRSQRFSVIRKERTR